MNLIGGDMNEKFKLPQLKTKQRGLSTSVMLRLPEDLIRPFNEVRDKSGISAQALVVSMVRHCLNDLKQPKVG